MYKRAKTIVFPSMLFAGRHAHDGDMKLLMGLNPEDKWPAAGMPLRIIHGVSVWVNPMPEKKPGQRRAFSLRCMAQCPKCGKVLTASRLQQHIVIHE